jgi:WD40 repeat protein
VDDAELYFGREPALADCLRRLHTDGVLVVAGPSGIGKSSLVRAGLTARLRAEGHRVTVVTPGPRPGDMLAAVSETSPGATLVVDQCEEALLCPLPDQRQRFLAGLCTWAEHDPLVVTLRGDRLSQLGDHPDFARLVERGLHLLGPPSPEGLRDIIELPAQRAGLLLEPGLVDLLLRDVAGDPGALPLVSHALRQTWLRREGRTLTVAGYADSGGIRGAIAQSAESVYLDLSDEQRRHVRDLMLRLVEPTVDGDPTRLRVARHQVVVDPETDELVERLIDARLLTSDEFGIEMAHEALARAWPRLRVWLEEDLEGQRIRHHLTMSAGSWLAMDRAPSELYRGPRLATALAWRESAGPSLTALEQEFLDAAAIHEQEELATTRVQLLRERRTVRRLRWLTAGVTALTLLAGIAWFTAAQQRGLAVERSTAAEARRLAARALVEPPYDRALLLAVEAAHLSDTPDVRGNVLDTITRSPLAAATYRTGVAGLRDFELTPDGGTAMVLDDDQGLSLLDLRERRTRVDRADDGLKFVGPTLSADGTLIATAWENSDCPIHRCSDTGMRLLHADDLSDASPPFEGFPFPIVDLAFSPAGDLIAGRSALPLHGPPDNVVIWRTDRPERPAQWLDMTEVGVARGSEEFLSFSPDGRRLYVSGAGPTVAFDVESGRPVRTFPGMGGLALSPDGQTLVVSESDNSASLMDTRSGKRRARLVGHASAVTAAAFIPDGSLVATASGDHTVALWASRDGARTGLLEGHAGSVQDVGFAGDQDLWSAGSDGSLIRWGLGRVSGPLRTVIRAGPFEMQTYNPPPVPQGTHAMFVLDGERWLVVDGASAEVTPLQVQPGEQVDGAAFHPGADRLVSVNYGIGWGRVMLWDTTTGAAVAEADSRGSGNWGAVAYTPDGRHVVVADDDGRVHRLDGVTLAAREIALQVTGVPVGVQATHGGVVAVITRDRSLTGPTRAVFADLDDDVILSSHELGRQVLHGAFSPDGRRYGFGGNGAVGVIDLVSGTVRRSPERVHEGFVTGVTFSTDGATLITVGDEGRVLMSDAYDARPIARLDTAKPGVPGVAAPHADGHTVILAFADGEILSFDTDPDAWTAHACAVAGRNLTPTEWADALGTRPYRETCPAMPVPDATVR